MSQAKIARVKPRHVTARERIEARFAKVSGWVNQVDAEISALYHRDTISGVDGAIFLINWALVYPSKPVLNEAKMAELKDRPCQGACFQHASQGRSALDGNQGAGAGHDDRESAFG